MRTLVVSTVLMLTASARANMQITEYMYSGLDGEYIEFTNMGGSPIDLTGWSYDDTDRVPGSVDLSAFGIVQPGESVILTEIDAVTFSTNWGGLPGVDVIGFNAHNLSRNDEINIYDAGSLLVDRLTFGDQTFPGTIRTQNRSGWTPPSNLGPQTINTQWVLSSVADAQNSYTGLNGDIGNPGTYVPEPATIALLIVGGVIMSRRRRAGSI